MNDTDFQFIINPPKRSVSGQIVMGENFGLYTESEIKEINMWQKALSVGGGGVEPIYVGIRYVSGYYYFVYVSQESTPKSAQYSISSTEGSGLTVSTPIATFVHTPNSHTFTVTYLMDCDVNGIKKSAGTTETINNFYIDNLDSVWIAYP